MEQFRATSRTQDGAVVVDLAGPLDRESQPQLEHAFDDALARVDGPVVLNFTDVGFINSTGIALIVGVLARGRAARREVRAYGLSDHYRHIFDITRLSDFIDVHDDERGALRPEEEGSHA